MRRSLAGSILFGYVVACMSAASADDVADPEVLEAMRLPPPKPLTESDRKELERHGIPAEPAQRLTPNADGFVMLKPDRAPLTAQQIERVLSSLPKAAREVSQKPRRHHRARHHGDQEVRAALAVSPGAFSQALAHDPARVAKLAQGAHADPSQVAALLEQLGHAMAQGNAAAPDGKMDLKALLEALPSEGLSPDALGSLQTMLPGLLRSLEQSTAAIQALPGQ